MKRVGVWATTSGSMSKNPGEKRWCAESKDATAERVPNDTDENFSICPWRQSGQY